MDIFRTKSHIVSVKLLPDPWFMKEIEYHPNGALKRVVFRDKSEWINLSEEETEKHTSAMRHLAKAAP